MKKVLYFFASLSLVLFLAISFVRWQFHDDLSFQNQLNTIPFFEFLYDKYMNWDARFLTPFGIAWFFIYKFIGYPYLLVLISVSFFFISWYIVKLIVKQANLSLELGQKLLLTALLNFLLWFSLQSLLPYTLYWTTASGYIVNVLFALIWIDFYLKQRENERFSVAFYLYTFFVSTSSQNITLGVWAIIFVDFLIHFLRKEKAKSKQQFLLLVLFSIGIVFATISPGSFVQLKKMQQFSYNGKAVEVPFVAYVDHFIHFYLDAFTSNGFYIIASALLFCFFTVIIYQKSIAFNSFKTVVFKFKLIELLKNTKWYLAAFFSLMVYWPTLLYSDRYYVGFYFFLFIALSFTLFKLISFKQDARKYLVLHFFVIAFSIGSCFIFYQSFCDSYLVHQFMKKRHALLEENRGKSKIQLNALNFNLGSFSKTTQSTEIAKSAARFENKSLSGYYKIDTVISSKFLTKQELKKQIENCVICF